LERVLSADRTPIAYQKSGAGPPLVLVHGVLGMASRWKAIIPELDKKFTVYAIDRRGRGASGDGDSYAIEREYEDVAAVVDSIGDPVHLLGHSFGALCVLEAACLTPNIRSLIAYEPPPAPVPEGLLGRIQNLLDGDDREGALSAFLSELVRMPPHELERFKASPVFPERLATVHTIPREFRAVENYHVEPERFAHLNVPALLLLGGDSPPFARKNVEDWHATLSNSQIVELPGQQHIAMDTAPDLFVRVVLTFLSNN
jgi:pimeloyl-ACP methyl ester carboxylesterase